MKRALLFFVGLAFIVPLPAEDFDRLQELLSAYHSNDPDVLERSEITALAEKPKARARMHELVREQAGESRQNFQHYISTLMLSGGGPAEVRLIAEIADACSDFSLGFYLQKLLEYGSHSLDSAIEKSLLGTLVERAAKAQRAQTFANALWLAHHRFPKLESRLEGAWRRFASKARREVIAAGNLMLYELQVLRPDGKPFDDFGYTRTLGGWSPSQQVFWPDGTVRFPWVIGRNPPTFLRLAVPGYRLADKLPVEARAGQVVKLTYTLGERRAIHRGRLSKAPDVPLFAMLDSAIPVARGPNEYFSNGGEYVVPIRSDGTFALPSRSRGGWALIFNRGGDVLHAEKVSPIAVDTDLGPIEIPARPERVSVPIVLEWPRNRPKGKSVQGYVEWKPLEPGRASGRSFCSVSSNGSISHATTVRWGMSRNILPGRYNVVVTIKKDKERPDLPKLEIPFEVTPGVEALVVRPTFPKDVDPETFPEVGTLVARGSDFLMRTDAQKTLHLLAENRRHVTWRARSAGETEFGDEHTIYRDDSAKEWSIGDLDFFPDSRGDLTVIIGKREGERVSQRQTYLYGVVKANSVSRRRPVRWVPLGRNKSPNLDHRDLTIIPRSGRFMNVFWTSSIAGDGDLLNMRIESGVISSGRFRSTASIRMGGPFQELFGHRLIAAERGGPQALFRRFDRARTLCWTGLEKFAPRPAGKIPLDANLSYLKWVPTSRNETLFAVPVRNGRVYDYTIARGRVGRSLRVVGQIRGVPSEGSFALASSGDGKVYLVGLSGERENSSYRVSVWTVSGAFPAEPILTPWRAKAFDEIQAISNKPGELTIAWSSSGGVFVESFAPER